MPRKRIIVYAPRFLPIEATGVGSQGLLTFHPYEKASRWEASDMMTAELHRETGPPTPRLPYRAER
jgi:hypothetical protein